jgi:hypothetical protein
LILVSSLSQAFPCAFSLDQLHLSVTRQYLVRRDMLPEDSEKENLFFAIVQ